MKTAEYRFLKSSSFVSFAKVTLSFEEDEEPLRVEIAANIEADRDKGIHSPDQVPDWFEAALRGAREALVHVSSDARPRCGRLLVTRVIGTVVDTQPDAVEVAAGMAACLLLAPGWPLPAISPTRPWRILFGGE
jgi:hypothetical protein